MKIRKDWPNLLITPETEVERRDCWHLAKHTPWTFCYSLKAWVVPLFAVSALSDRLKAHLRDVDLSPPERPTVCPLQLSHLPSYLRPYPFQPPVILNMVAGPLGVWAACGVGKTLMTLAAYEILASRGEVDGLLVVGPEAGRHVWCGEDSDAEKWIDAGGHYIETGAKEPPPTSGIVYVTAAKIFRDPYQTWLYDLVRTRRWILCIDECDQSAGALTQRYQVLQCWSQLCRWRWCLSATPVRNYPSSFWGLYRILTGDTHIEHSQWVEWLRKGRSNKAWREDRVEQVGEWLSYCTVTIRKQDVAPWLPPVTEHVIKVKMKGRQRALYTELVGAARMTLQEQSGQTKTVVVRQLLHHLSSLQSVASHPIVAGDTDWKDRDIAKLEYLQHLISCHHGEKICIWSWHPDVLEWLADRLEGSVQYHGRVPSSDRQTAVKRFNEDPDCRFFLGNPMSAGASLNLGAGTVRIYWDLGWSWSEYHQSGERINRITRKLPITSYTLLSEGSVELVMWNAIARKMELASAMVAGGQTTQGAAFALDAAEEVLQLWK